MYGYLFFFILNKIYEWFLYKIINVNLILLMVIIDKLIM